MRLVNRTRKPVGGDVTSVRIISPIAHGQGRKQWETQGPGRVDAVNANKARPR
jgi:hypothetical protein